MNKETKYRIIFLSCLFLFQLQIYSQPGCASINAGNDQTICNGNSANLSSTYLATGATTTYSVSSIPYAPPYSYNAGTPVLVNIDDTWTSALNIPFTFCFFGNSYTQLVAGSNGMISFNLTNAGKWCEWKYTESCPNPDIVYYATNNPWKSLGPFIFGPYHDIDPSVAGDMYYNTYGSYPCRTFVVSWKDVAMFKTSCNSLLATHMIVLYESTNVIEVYIQNAPLCSDWNDGNKCIGIQNAAGTLGFTPPGRNTGAWETSNEAWRFTPNGTQNYTVSWWQGSTQIASGATTTVSPANTTTYTAQIVYTNCNSAQITVTDNLTVNVNPIPVATATPSSQTICSGGTTGIALSSNVIGTTYSWTASATGSVTGYSSGSGNSIAQTITNTGTSAGTVTYTITPVANSCTGTPITATITINPIPVVTASPTSQTLCSGGTTGISLSSNVTGTTYSWTASATGSISGYSSGSGNSIAQTLTNSGASAGTVTYTITPTANTCSGTPVNVVITVNPKPTAVLSGTTTICPGVNTNLQVILTGTAPWTYTYNDGTNHTVTLNSSPATITVNPTSATTYTPVSVTDANCTGTVSGSATISVDPAIVVSNINTICNGPFTQYQVTFNISGGNPSAYSVTPSGTITPGSPYTYTSGWINSGSPYSFSITDNYNCNPQVISGTKTCNCPATGTLSGNATICAGNSTNLTIALAGASPWTVVYSNGSSNTTISNITSSPYTFSVSPSTTTTYSLVSATDANCTGTSSGSATITVNQLPIASATPSTQSFCTGGTTSINLSSTVAGTTFSWTASSASGITGFSNGTGNIISQTLTNPGSSNGTVTYIVTPVANSCTGTPINVVVTVYPSPTANAGTDQIICSGQNANLTAYGGVSYSWSNTATSQSTNVSPTSNTLYIVTVTSANGCTASDDVLVSVNPLPPANAGPDQGICINSSTTLNASGGTIYSWSPTSYLDNPLISNPAANPTSTTIYTVTVTDANGCSATDNMTLTVYTSLPVNAGTDQAICNGESTNLSAIGGTYYSWSPSTGLSSTTIANPVANPTTTTTYIVTISDTHGCSATDDIIITVSPVPASGFTLLSPICVGQTSEINYIGNAGTAATYDWDFNGGTVVSGTGQGPYQISWASPSTYNISLTVTENGCSTTTSQSQVVGQVTVSIIITHPISCNNANDGAVSVNASGAPPYQYLWSTQETTREIQNLSDNTAYSVTVTDNNGCVTVDSISLLEPKPLFINLTTTNVSCYGGNNGTALAIVSGGIFPYQYSWLPSGTAGNINSVTTLTEGTYTFTVLDANGCSKDTTFTISQPPLLTYSYTSDSVNCHSGSDGSIILNVSGGVPAYIYNWNPSVSSDSSALNIQAGTYSVTISDQNSCSASTSINIGEPPALILSNSGDVTICNSQSTTISANASGGTGSYIFTWDNGLGTGSSFNVNPTSTTTYTVSVTDENGCTVPSQTLTVYVSPPIYVTVTADPSSFCYGESTQLTASATGGNGSYVYYWNNGIGISTSTITISPTTSTTYVVTVTDGCNSPQGVDSILITVYPLPQILFAGDTIKGCVPLTVNFSDSSSPAISSWLWNFGDFQSGINNHSALQSPSHTFSLPGKYSITLYATTTHGCTDSATYQEYIEVYPIPEANFYYDPEVISILNSTVTFTDISTDAAYWNWNFDDEISLSENFSDIQSPTHYFNNSGSYDVVLTVISQFGCIDSISKTIIVNPEFTFFVPNTFTPNGDGVNDYFYPVGEGFDLNNYEMDIYDRWGEIVFKTNNYYEYWDGKKMGKSDVAPQGVYSWIVELKDFSGKRHLYTGKVNLMK
ncbi:MAG TPA: gliding motility-associated C-terminal domain-containing protein [Bacteroidales bacterium]|nr:gliding motility-associated C-terminal domain-containing protein [Bacteroidales bacterium]HPS15670.1 gliding motility-associated C-terminal domain-containing protein [Bacteroidales bacterium]